MNQPSLDLSLHFMRYFVYKHIRQLLLRRHEPCLHLFTDWFIPVSLLFLYLFSQESWENTYHFVALAKLLVPGATFVNVQGLILSRSEGHRSKNHCWVLKMEVRRNNWLWHVLHTLIKVATDATRFLTYWTSFCFFISSQDRKLPIILQQRAFPIWMFVYADRRHGFMPFWFILNGLQLFLRFGLSEKSPDANACWNHSSNSSSSGFISASKLHGYLEGFNLCTVFMFTWKLGLWVFGLHAIPCLKFKLQNKKQTRCYAFDIFLTKYCWYSICV